MSLVGTPIQIRHWEVNTPECICDKLPCGGVESAHLGCPEHGHHAGALLKFHTHGLQTGRISVGTYNKV